jgi:hypothetical protein
MYELPKTTFTFSAMTFDEKNDEDSEVRVEFSRREEMLDEVLEKVTDFLRAAGFGYIDRLEPITRTNFSNTEYEDPITSEKYGYGAFGEPQPDVSLDLHWDDFPNSTEDARDWAGAGGDDGQMSCNFESDKIDLSMGYESDFKYSITPDPVKVTTSPVTDYSYSVNYGDVNITSAGVKVRNSIDDVTPEEWNEANRKWMRKVK